MPSTAHYGMLSPRLPAGLQEHTPLPTPALCMTHDPHFCTPDEADTQVLCLGEDLSLAYMELTTFPEGYPSLDAHPKCLGTKAVKHSSLCILCSPTCEKQSQMCNTAVHGGCSSVHSMQPHMCNAGMHIQHSSPSTTEPPVHNAGMQNTMKMPHCCLCNSPAAGHLLSVKVSRVPIGQEPSGPCWFPPCSEVTQTQHQCAG